MENNKQTSVLRYQIEKKVTQKITERYYPHLTGKNKTRYNDKMFEYKDKIKYRTKEITMKKFLHIEAKEGNQYESHIIDIAYIIALIYEDEQYQKIFKPFKNKIITGMENTLEVNELASIFFPFYDRKNWEHLNEKFLKRHEETYYRFLELQKHDPQSCLSDIKQFCIAFYNHEELPPIEKYNELIEIHKKYKI